MRASPATRTGPGYLSSVQQTIGPFHLDFGNAPQPITEGISAWLGESLHSGVEFVPDQTVQLGGLLLRVARRNEGLTLLAPTPGSFPLEWQEDLSHAVLDMARQRYSADSLGLADQMDFAHLGQPGIVCTQAHPDQTLLMMREAPLDSGATWWVLCRDAEHDHDHPDALEQKSLFEITGKIPVLTSFLALPVGTQILSRPGSPLQAMFQGDRIEIDPESYLGRLKM